MAERKSPDVVAAEVLALAMGLEVKSAPNEYKVLPSASVRCSEAAVSMAVSAFMDGVMKESLVYEAISDEVVPFYDYDEKVGDPSALVAAHHAAHRKCSEALVAVWGPDARITCFMSTGNKKSESYTGPFVSLRFIVRGCGKFACGADIKLAGKVPEIFDQSVYKVKGSRQLMRVFGASKEGEQRPMQLVVNGGFRKLGDFYKEDPALAEFTFEQSLAQNVRGEQLFEVKQPEPVPRMLISVGENGAAIGENGEPLGSDIEIKSVAQIEALCRIAGWFGEVNRDGDTYREETWLLRNTADTCGLDVEEMRGLAQRIAAVCANNNPHHVNEIFDQTAHRNPNKKRQLLGHLRGQAMKKNEGEYLRWVQSVRKDKPRDPERKPYLFIDHLAFVGKEIHPKTAEQWLADALIVVVNGGESYCLTRNEKVCEKTNMKFETWMHTNTDKMLKCLDKRVLILNPLWMEGMPEDQKYSYTTFGGATKISGCGFVQAQIHRGKVRSVSREDFIPHLARRIPDANVAAAVKDKMMFNKFREFPIERFAYKREAPQFLGSAWHKHLRDDICHGDATEWKHLEGTIADMIQRPYRVSNVAHVFQGRQGTGKSFLYKFMSNLIGAGHTMLITDMDVYMQKFNEDQSMAILKVFEEVRAKGDHFMNNDRLKADITKDKLRVEIKGGSIFEIRHCARYWMLTNHRDPLHLEADDRRYVFHSVSDAHANNWDYFAPIVAELENWDYIRACFEYFAELPYEERFVMNAITTSYKVEQKLESLNLPLKFMRDFIEEGLIDQIDPMRKDGNKISSMALYEAFKMWCSTKGCSSCSQMTFSKAVAYVGVEPKNGRLAGSVMKVVTIERNAIRDAFRTHLTMPSFDWRV